MGLLCPESETFLAEAARRYGDAGRPSGLGSQPTSSQESPVPVSVFDETSLANAFAQSLLSSFQTSWHGL